MPDSGHVELTARHRHHALRYLGVLICGHQHQRAVIGDRTAPKAASRIRISRQGIVKASHIDTGDVGDEAVRRRRIVGLVGEGHHRLLAELSGDQFGDTGQLTLSTQAR